MKELFLIFLFLQNYNIIFGQYIYGLDVCNQDAKIEGKLNLDAGDNNLIIGKDAGISLVDSEFNTIIGPEAGKILEYGLENTFIGYRAGYKLVGFSNLANGDDNVYIGAKSGFNSTNGLSNVFLGIESGYNNVGGIENTFIGRRSGYNNNGERGIFLGGWTGYNNTTGNRNIFIGYKAGYYSTGSDLLYIENSDTNSPLIYGEFNNNKVQINGSLHVSDALQLIPQATPSGSCVDNGEMIFGTDNELYLCKSGTWKIVVTN